MKSHTEQMMYKVVRPTGEATVKAGHLAPRLDTLNGKTIGEVNDGVFRGERTFPKIRELLKKRYPEINFVPYTEFPPLDVIRNLEEVLQALPDMLRQKGCDALIAGNAG